MDAVKYLKLKKRMGNGCNVGSNCDGCVLRNNLYKMDCLIYELEHPEEAVAAVGKWVEEHPVKTRMDKFLEIYPDAIVNTIIDGTFVDICLLLVDSLYGKCNLQSEDINNCLLCKISYWNEEVEE